MLRVIGDVHGQVDEENLTRRNARPYLELIAGVQSSVQVGDLGDAETYAALTACVDATSHRFLPGNHDHYQCLPPHSLGDYGWTTLGGVEFFFVRGASSEDRDKLIRVGRELGRKLWHEEEELTDEQMLAAEQEYLRTRPATVISHDAPADVAYLIYEYVRRTRAPDPAAVFRASRTNRFLARLFEQHQPRLWLFGHHHRDWRYRAGDTTFVCVGELSYVDVDESGNLLGR